MTPDQVDLTSLPWGLCPDCLARMSHGSEYEAVTLKDGTILVQAYCEHREAGALGIIRPGKPARWKIDAPVEILDWQRGLAARIPALAETMALFAGPSKKTDIN